MKKRILSFVLVLAVLAGMIVMPASAAGKTIDAYCTHCDKTVTWQALESSSDKPIGNDHYYMAPSAASITYGQITIPKDTEVCLHLEKKDYIGNRHLTISEGATLNLMSTGGTLSCRGSDDFASPGGAIWVKEGATLNMYSGTVTYKTHSVATRGVDNGGAIAVDGTFNMYGGTVTAGVARTQGGTVYVGPTGQFNMYGGTVLDGTAPTGSCVYNSGKVLLEKDASIDAILQAPVEGGPALEDMLTVSGTYTGSVNVLFDRTLTAGQTVGVSKDANISDAKLLLPGTDFKLKVAGSQLVTYVPGVAENKQTGDSYETMAQAMENAQAGDILVLQKSTSESFTSNTPVILDLDGHNITGTVTAAAGSTLYIKDSQTADYDVSDGVYGKITAVAGDVRGAEATEAADVYMKVTEEDGISFHAVSLNITDMALKPGDAALYFINTFQGDTLATGSVESYGVALSIQGVPETATMGKSTKYTVFEGDTFGTETEGTSSLVYNILSDQVGDAANNRNAATKIYGRAYIKTAAGEYVFGVTRQRSLREQVEAIDRKWNDLVYQQKEDMLTLFRKFPAVISSWATEKIQNAEKLGEDAVMKILSIGQSHSQDSIWLFQEVLQTEMPDAQFLIAECLKSVTLVDHVKNAINEEPVYIYYTNTEGRWDMKSNEHDYTIRQALEDQKWDYIIINESSRYLGLESTMEKGYVDQMINYIRGVVGNEPKLLYNWTWATPEHQGFYDPDFVPQPSSTFWANFVKDYNGDSVYHYEAMRSMVNKYIVPNKDFDRILYSATPIQYAVQVLGVDEMLMYRDYIHLSDYGRLFIGYMWYCQLYGIEQLTEINVKVVKEHLRFWRFEHSGDVVLTEEMKDWLMESVNWALKHPMEMPHEVEATE